MTSIRPCHKSYLVGISHLFIISVLTVGGCGTKVSQVPVLLPPHIRSVAAAPIANKTQFSGLEDKLWLAVTQEIIQDGRLSLVNDAAKANGVIRGEITRYILEPVSYDANHVIQQYKLLVLLDLKFEDQTEGKILWEEPRMEQSYIFFVSTLPGGLTEEQAREIIWSNFARDIVKRTIEGFGTVTGSSPRRLEGQAPSPPPPTSTLPPGSPYPQAPQKSTAPVTSQSPSPAPPPSPYYTPY